MGNLNSTHQQQQRHHVAPPRGRPSACATATGSATLDDSDAHHSLRHHKTRRSQESRRRRASRRQSSSSPSTAHRTNSSNSSRNSSGHASDATTQQQQEKHLDSAVKMQHSLSDATTSSSNESSSPESPNDTNVSGYDSARVHNSSSSSDHVDLLSSLRMRYHDAVPRIARVSDTHASASSASGRDASSSVVSSVMHQLACMQWRSYIPCIREQSECESSSSRASRVSSSSSTTAAAGAEQRSSPLSASAYFFSYDVKFVMEQKHRTFWELVQKLLILNDAVVMIRLVLEYLETHLDAASCAVFLIDQSTQVMSRFSPGETSVSGIDIARGVLGRTLATRDAVCCQNFAAEACYDREIDLDQTWSKQKLLSVPLIENDVVYAVIQATTKKSTRAELDALHVKLLSWLGPILGSCMRKCIEFHDVLLSDRTQKALLHIISSSDTEDTVLNLVDGVIAGACHITKAERLTLFMVDWETEELWSLSSSYRAETLRLPLHAGIVGAAATTRAILNVSDPASDARYKRRYDHRHGVQTRCALYVPVGVQNTKTDGSSRPIAVLEILNKVDGDEFTFDDECAFEAFASQVAVILRRRNNEIEYLKLLADTRAEKVLAQRAKSQVNILEQYTSYSSTMRGHPSECLRNSFVKSHVRDCASCACRSTQDCSVHRNTGMTRNSSWHRALERQLSKAASTGPSIPSWDFNVFLADMDTLPQLVEDMFAKFDVPKVLGISRQRMQNFILVVKENYHPNPFHNFLHAFSVVHTAYLLLSTTDAARMLRPLDIAGCLIAALCHDVDHPGHTNAFEIQSGSQLAMLYSDESVLERHHAYTTFKLIAKEKNANILEHLSPSDYRHIRKVIITAILGTDMAGHFKFCETLEKTLNPPVRQFSSNALVPPKKEAKTLDGAAFGSGSDKTNSSNSSSRSEIRTVLRDAVFQSEGSAANTPRNASGPAPPIGFCFGKTFSGTSTSSCSRRELGNGWAFNGTVDERIFLVKTIVHASDLSGQVFTKPVALKWSNMISKEFAYQALLEQAENHPISYHHLNDPLQMVEGQLFFAQKIVAPLWDLMLAMFPEVDVCVKNLAENVAHYEQELQRLKLVSVGDDDDNVTSRSMSDAMSISATAEWQQQFDSEGLAVPGLAKCTPARFNSFRSLREVSESFDEGDDTWGTDRSVRDFAASALDAIERARQASARSRSNGNSSDDDEEDDDDDDDVQDLDESDYASLLG